MSYTDAQLDFLEKANERISNNPATRLSDITKSTLERKNFIFDAHCHVFDGECVSVKYLVIRLLYGVPEIMKSTLWRIITGERLTYKTETLTTHSLIEIIQEQPNKMLGEGDMDAFLNRAEAEIDTIEKELEESDQKLVGLRIRPFLLRYRDIFRLLKTGRMSDVYTIFRDRYAIQNIFNDLYHTDRELLTVVLGMDLNSGWQNSSSKTNAEQNQELGQLPQAYPVLPYLPVDPRRADLDGEENLYNIFLNAFDKDNPTFFGVKCYPALGYLPSDSRLKPIFKVCAEKNIPVMTHCGGEVISTFADPIIVNRNGVEESISLNPRTERARYLNEPREWWEVLREHAGLNLCLGHFGGVGAWKKPHGKYSNRIPTIIKMMNEFNVYADFSFNIDSEKASRNLVNKLEQDNDEGELLRGRVLFGTDYWVILPLSDLKSDQRRFLNQIGGLEEFLLNKNVLNYLGLEEYV